jgi:hypothetical protein
MRARRGGREYQAKNRGNHVEPPTTRIDRAKKFLLAGAGFVALAGPVALGLMIGVAHAPAIHAQSPARSLTQTSAAAPAEPVQVAQAQAMPAPKTPVTATAQQSVAATSKPEFDVEPAAPALPAQDKLKAKTSYAPASPSGSARIVTSLR